MSQLIEARVYDGETWCRASDVALALGQAVLTEREACAKVCEREWQRFGYSADARDCAEEIRRRD